MDMVFERKSQQDLMKEKNRLLKKADANQYANKINIDIQNAMSSNNREQNRQNMLTNYRQEQRNQIEDNKIKQFNRPIYDKSVNMSKSTVPIHHTYSPKMEPKVVRFESGFMDQDKRNSTLEGEEFFEDKPNAQPKSSLSKSSGRSLGVFGSLMAIEKMQKEALEKSQVLDEMVEEQIQEYEERKTLKNRQKSRDNLQNDIKKFYRSKMSTDPHQDPQSSTSIEPLNPVAVARDAQSALIKSKEILEKIQNSKSNFDKLIRIQDQQSDPETATQAMKHLWNKQQREDAKAKRSMQKRPF